MVSFRVIADSTADLPESYSVPLVPVHVYAGIAEFRDKVDFDIQVLEDLARKGIKRRTAAPSVKEWMHAFEGLGNELPIVAYTISSKLSSSYNSARIAAQMLQKKGFRIRVIDSMNGGIGIGIQVARALELADSDTPFEEAVAVLEALPERVRTYLVVADMDAAARSGRIPALVGKIGKFFDLHPVFHVVGGEIHLWKTFRGIDPVIKALEELSGEEDEVWVGEVGESEHARQIYRKLRAAGKKTVLVQTDPAIGAHFGVGAFGISYVQGSGRNF